MSRRICALSLSRGRVVRPCGVGAVGISSLRWIPEERGDVRNLADELYGTAA